MRILQLIRSILVLFLLVSCDPIPEYELLPGEASYDFIIDPKAKVPSDFDFGGYESGLYGENSRLLLSRDQSGKLIRITYIVKIRGDETKEFILLESSRSLELLSKQFNYTLKVKINYPNPE